MGKRETNTVDRPKNWTHHDKPLPGLDTFDPISPRWQETWLCICGARHTGQRRVVEAHPAFTYSHRHEPVEWAA